MLPFIPNSANWQYETVPQAGLNGRRGYVPRGRGMGGSSAINAMLYVRGAPWDYDNWARLGATGWSYADVLPWFKRAEGNVRGPDDFHGGDGPLVVSDQLWPNPGSLEFIEAAASMQLPRNSDFNGARFEGVGLYQVTQRKGERWSAARAYLDPAIAAGRIAVKAGALVERIGFQEGRARTVYLRMGATRTSIRARGAIILAGGVFGTAQLLMLSGIGPADHLRANGIDPVVDRAGVGSNLQDHVDYVAGYETGGSLFMGQSLKGSLASAAALVRWFRNRSGPITTPYAEAGGFVRTRADLELPDIQLHFLPALLEDHGRTKVRTHGFSCHACVLRPESSGSVRLAGPDAATMPLIDPAFLADDRDMATLLAGVRLMRRIVERPPLSAHGGRDRHMAGITDDAGMIRIIRDRADTIYHPVGTARMGSDEAAVCDPRLRVRGVEGLYVADASVMPKLISGNTNAPAIMIGERCANFVGTDLGG